MKQTISRITSENNYKTTKILGIPYVHRRHIVARIVIVATMLLFLLLLLGICAMQDTSQYSYAQSFSMGLDMAALAGVTILCFVYSMDGSTPDQTVPLFYTLLILDYMELYAYIIGWLAEGEAHLIGIYHASNIVNFAASPLMCFIFWSYQRRLYPGKLKNETRVNKVYATLIAFDYLYIFGNLKYGYLYTISPEGCYQAQKGYVVTTLIPFLMLGNCLVGILRQKFSLRKKMTLLAFPLAPIIATGTSIFIEGYTYNYVVVFLVLLLIYGSIQIERNIKLAEQKEELTEKSILLMRSQIQPAFLDNTLETICDLCEEDAPLARQVADRFSKYLQMNMKSLDAGMFVPFAMELEHIQNYLWIEQQRLGEKLEVVYDIEVTNFEIPPITVQPLVENAVKHGISKNENGGTITLRTQRQGRDVLITIEDDGPGLVAANLKTKDEQQVGIANVRERIKLLCNGEVKQVSIKDKGTAVTIRLPQ